MTKRALILTALAVLLLSGCDRDYYINDGCTLNDTSCIDDVEYICMSGSQSEDKDFVNPNNYSLIDGFSTIDSNNEAHYWQFSKACLNGCNSNGTACLECQNGKAEKGKCVCPDSCINKCNEDGSCKCHISCPNDCEPDGKCKCSPSCVNGCNDDGTCISTEGCKNGIDQSSGACVCPASCPNGCNPDGSCSCSPNCVNGCNDDGSCIPTEGCHNGIDQNTGTCLCPNGCKNGCDNKGEKCLCLSTCTGGCDELGACTCEASCVEGSLCDVTTGQCACIDKCKAGCDETGTCDEACENVECKGANEQCIKGECIDLCKGITCEKADEYCKIGKCIYNDANHNHMHDMHETATTQGQDCRKYSDCDSEPGRGDGFCDSFIGYKCSTKCTDASQCIDDKDYHYICRPDGRCAPDSFITVWKIPDNNKVLRIPTSQAEAYDFTIDWGDGSQSESCSKTNCKQDENGDLLHTYQNSDTYTVKITGQYDGFRWPYTFKTAYYEYKHINDDNSPIKLYEIKSFGPVGLSSFVFATSTLNAFSTIDIPDATKMSDLSFAFYKSSFNLPIESWDMSYVTDIRGMFRDTNKFNQPLDHWDTSNIKWMGTKPENYIFLPGNYADEGVFSGALAFNQDLDNWDTSKVISMSYLFNASSFNGSINNWNTSNVVYMYRTFKNATNFNQPLNNWNTSNVTDMCQTFFEATSFNQPLNKWDTSNVTNMSSMFSGAKNFNQAIGEWNTSKVTDMSFMFSGATAFNQPIGNWNTQSVISMVDMFKDAEAFNQPINDWDTYTSVKNMRNMFSGAKSFNQPLDKWTPFHVTDMSSMFLNAESFNSEIFNKKFSTTNVTDMSQMFSGATSFDQPLNKWEVSNVTNFGNMFSGATTFNQDLSTWKLNENTSVSNIFSNSKISAENYCKIYKAWKNYIPNLNTSDLGKAGMICN